MKIEVKQNYELLALSQNGFFSDRYKRPTYDALIDRHTDSALQRYVVCFGYCIEDGTWDNGRYFDSKCQADRYFKKYSGFTV